MLGHSTETLFFSFRSHLSTTETGLALAKPLYHPPIWLLLFLHCLQQPFSPQMSLFPSSSLWWLCWNWNLAGNLAEQTWGLVSPCAQEQQITPRKKTTCQNTNGQHHENVQVWGQRCHLHVRISRCRINFPYKYVEWMHQAFCITKHKDFLSPFVWLLGDILFSTGSTFEKGPFVHE